MLIKAVAEGRETKVNLPGWASGNTLTVFVEDQGSTSTRRVSTVEAGAAKTPVLRVEYAVP